MTTAEDRARAHVLVDDLLGPADSAAHQVVTVLHAHAAALAWVRDTTGTYPASPSVAARLDTAADRLRSGVDSRDPEAMLGQVAADALAEYRATVT